MSFAQDIRNAYDSRDRAQLERLLAKLDQRRPDCSHVDCPNRKPLTAAPPDHAVGGRVLPTCRE